MPDLHRRLQARERHHARRAVAAGPRRRDRHISGRPAPVPGRGVPALRKPALCTGVPDRGDVSAPGWSGGDGLRSLHRLRLLRGGLPVSGAHHCPRPGLVLRGRDSTGVEGLASGAHRGRAEVHVLCGENRRCSRAPTYSRRRSGRHPGLRERLHRASDPLRRLQRRAQQCLSARGGELELSDARRARHRSADQVPLRDPGGARGARAETKPTSPIPSIR